SFPLWPLLQVSWVSQSAFVVQASSSPTQAPPTHWPSTSQSAFVLQVRLSSLQTPAWHSSMPSQSAFVVQVSSQLLLLHCSSKSQSLFVAHWSLSPPSSSSPSSLSASSFPHWPLLQV